MIILRRSSTMVFGQSWISPPVWVRRWMQEPSQFRHGWHHIHDAPPGWGSPQQTGMLGHLVGANRIILPANACLLCLRKSIGWQDSRMALRDWFDVVFLVAQELCCMGGYILYINWMRPRTKTTEVNQANLQCFEDLIEHFISWEQISSIYVCDVKGHDAWMFVLITTSTCCAISYIPLMCLWYVSYSGTWSTCVSSSVRPLLHTFVTLMSIAVGRIQISLASLRNACLNVNVYVYSVFFRRFR